MNNTISEIDELIKANNIAIKKSQEEVKKHTTTIDVLRSQNDWLEQIRTTALQESEGE